MKGKAMNMKLECGAGQSGRAECLTFVARRPGLVAVVAGDAQNSVLNGSEPRRPAGEVLHRARPFQILFNRLVHHQVLELPELGADVRQSPGTHIG